VVGLHGGGVRGTNNKSQIAGCVPAQVLSEQVNRKKYPSFVFVPQCPDGYNWGGYHNHPAMIDPSIDSLVFEAIYALEDKLSIDKRRCYVTGESLGGYGTWHFICLHPEMFAAAIPISGAGDPGLAPKIVDIPVWAFHGKQDGIVSVRGTRDMIDAIRKAGGSPRYTELPSAGHGMGYLVFINPGTPGLLEWLFEQRKGAPGGEFTG
jgi:predicted peptidase